MERQPEVAEATLSFLEDGRTTIVPEYDVELRQAHARNGDPWTSHAAARSLGDRKLRETQEAVLTAFRTFGPMHHEQLVAAYESLGLRRQSVSGLRTRTSELVALGHLRDSGRVTTLVSGRKSIIWELT